MDPEFIIQYLQLRWNVIAICSVSETGVISTVVYSDNVFGYDLSALPVQLVYDPSFDVFFTSEEVLKQFRTKFPKNQESIRMLARLERHVFVDEKEPRIFSFDQENITIGFGRWHERPQNWYSFGDIKTTSSYFVQRHEQALKKLEKIINKLTTSRGIREDGDALLRQDAAEGLLRLSFLHISEETIATTHVGGGALIAEPPLSKTGEHGSALQKAEPPLSITGEHGGALRRVTGEHGGALRRVTGEGGGGATVGTPKSFGVAVLDEPRDFSSHTFERRIENLAQRGLPSRRHDDLNRLRETLDTRHWETGLNRFGTLTRQRGSHMTFNIRGKGLTAPLGHGGDLKRGTRNAMMEQLLLILEDFEDLSIL